jgi:ATP-binding cassette subfamily B multidrug efflux pump
MPAMTFIGNLVYVGIAVVGVLQVASGAMQLGDVQAFIQYLRQFTMPRVQMRSMANMLQSGVASAERVSSLLDEDEESVEPGPSTAPVFGRAATVLGRLVLLLAGEAADLFTF